MRYVSLMLGMQAGQECVGGIQRAIHPSHAISSTHFYLLCCSCGALIAGVAGLFKDRYAQARGIKDTVYSLDWREPEGCLGLWT